MEAPFTERRRYINEPLNRQARAPLCGVKELPQFKQLEKNIYFLHSQINTAGFSAHEKNFKLKPENFIGEPFDIGVQHETKEIWEDFIFHDLRNKSASISLISQLIGSLNPTSENAQSLSGFGLNATKVYKDPTSSSRDKIRSINECVSYFRTNKAENFVSPTQIKDKEETLSRIKTMELAVKMWDMIVNSAFLLNGVRERDYAEIDRSFSVLKNIKVRIGDVTSAIIKNNVITIDSELENESIDGLTGIMFFNLIKNAASHKKSYIKVYKKKGNLVVENDVNEPIDTSNLYQPMQPGRKGGGTGFGLFTAQNIFGTLSETIVLCNNKSILEGGHAVTFTLKKSRPEG